VNAAVLGGAKRLEASGAGRGAGAPGAGGIFGAESFEWGRAQGGGEVCVWFEECFEKVDAMGWRTVKRRERIGPGVAKGLEASEAGRGAGAPRVGTASGVAAVPGGGRILPCFPVVRRILADTIPP